MTDNKIKIFHKKEADFIREFMDTLKKMHPMIWSFKSHGEPMQVRGVPDIIMCYYGLFIALEFKIMRNGSITYSPLQEYTLELINKAHGFALTVWFDNKTSEIGIGSRRFKNRKEAIEFLLAVLGPMADSIRKLIEKIKEYNPT